MEKEIYRKNPALVWTFEEMTDAQRFEFADSLCEGLVKETTPDVDGICLVVVSNAMGVSTSVILEHPGAPRPKEAVVIHQINTLRDHADRLERQLHGGIE